MADPVTDERGDERSEAWTPESALAYIESRPGDATADAIIRSLVAALVSVEADLAAKDAEIERLADRAVCSGCGQNVDEGGGCETEGCERGEMIPSSDLPAAMRENLNNWNEEREEWGADWEQLRGEAKGLEAALSTALQALRDLRDLDSATVMTKKIAAEALAQIEAGGVPREDTPHRSMSEIHRDVVSTQNREGQLAGGATGPVAPPGVSPPQEPRCECGHPHEAHALRYDGPKDPSGRRTARESCRATVTVRRQHGDDSWACPCRDFRAVVAPPETQEPGK